MANDEQAIRDLIATWMRATAEGDLPQILRLMADDAIFLTPGQPPMRGREVFAAGFKQALQEFRLEATSDIQEIRILGDWAYCWNYLVVTMTPISDENSPTRRSGNVLTIFRQNADGEWVLYRDANLLGTEPGPKT